MQINKTLDPTRSGTKHPVVLVVEDEVLPRLAIAMELEREDWTVIEASSGESAIELLRTGQHVDTVITDIHLAGKQTGLDVAEAFRAEYPLMPIVYVSGKQRDAARCVAGSLFFAKPYSVARVVDAVRALIRLH